MAITKERSLYYIFLKSLIYFCILTVVLCLLLVGVFAIGLNTGIVLPANYAHNNLESLKQELESKKPFDVHQIKHPYRYVAFDENLEPIESTANGDQVAAATQYLDGKTMRTPYYYSSVEHEGGIVVILYDIKAHFSSETLDQLIPYPEYALLILFGVLFISMTTCIILRFGNQLKKELQPLKESTECIMRQELTFETKHTQVKEFNEILNSIDNLKHSLQQSLESQWNTEQSKKEQISALAHDIKTPLTIIKGNAEILTEVEFEEGEEAYVTYILKNTKKIETYIEYLAQIAQQDATLSIEFQQIDVEEILKEISDELKMLGKTKNIEIVFQRNVSVKKINANKDFLMRGIINIVTNAIDFSNKGDYIEFCVECVKNKLIFTVRDNGPGFSNEGIRLATSQFYMENTGRKVGSHYGLGLYIAKTIANKHGGEVVVKNREDQKGAEVSLSIAFG